ncbi:MAG: VOC family protein [Acidobacteriota bacterium]|nr:VOC family protein [Acidobacteriota bacterium]
MRKTIQFLLGSGLLLMRLQAQLAAPNNLGVTMGHLHLNAKDPAAQKSFWVDYVGATPAKLGPLDVYRLPGVIVFVNKAEPTGGTEGSVINHIGLKVRDLKAYVAKAAAANVKIVAQSATQAMLLAPDDIRVELTLDAGSSTPVAMHHIHFYVPDIDAAKKWYASVFGAIPGMRGKFEAADLPGVNLSFSKAETALAGTKGRSLDHIGFEVKDLENFTKKLEASGTKFNVTYRSVARLGIAIAFFTDPWNTYIELTEGLGHVE